MGKELFTNIPSKVKNLVEDIRIGKIGLPDLQRPFVWKDSRIASLEAKLRVYESGLESLSPKPQKSQR